MAKAEASHKWAITIESRESTFTGLPPLGTDMHEQETEHSVDEIPTAAEEHLITGAPTIRVPIDNDVKEITELNSREIEYLMGLLKISGISLEKWKKDSLYIGATLGEADYTVLNKTKYTPAEEFPLYRIRLYSNLKNSSGERIRSHAQWLLAVSGKTADEMIELKKVTFNSMETPREAGSRIKETFTLSAQTMSVEKTWTQP